jgi:signal transduction histidine kinase
MSLRLRILLTLLAITVILALPTAYGLSALRELRGIAHDLRTRDAESSLALGRLQTALKEVENSNRIYVAVGSQTPDAVRMGAELDAGMERVERQLDVLARSGYREPTAQARATWNATKQAIRRNQAQADSGRSNEASAFLRSGVDPAFEEMDRSLDPIGRAINTSGEQQVRRAQQAADGAATRTLVAFATALLLTVLIGGWLARSLLRPIGELRRGMTTVAQGDFDPDVRIPLNRTDELGDLARSFDSMTTQLTELDRLKAEFVSVASHEIKTPLSVIKGYVALLLDGIYGEVTDPQRKTLTAVSDQAERLARLVHRLLDVTRFEAGGGRLELREIEPRGFLSELTDGFEVLAYQNQIDFVVEVAPDVPQSIVADPERVNEVLGNLLSNAFKFTPKGGKIFLRAAAERGGMAVEVEDTGVGIPADKLPKIFEKFFQVENDAQPRSVGSGLGLAIAHEIVEAHGGTISADSEVGKGTRFRVFLPARPPAGTAQS